MGAGMLEALLDRPGSWWYWGLLRLLLLLLVQACYHTGDAVISSVLSKVIRYSVIDENWLED